MTISDMVKEWLRHAKSDLNTAIHMFEDVYPKETEIAAYHSQQCAEKALKAFLIANKIDPPKIHNLRALWKLCQNSGGGFSEIEVDCQKINKFGAEVRYPQELAPDETIVKAAINDAQKVYDFCVEKINALSQTNVPPAARGGFWR